MRILLSGNSPFCGTGYGVQPAQLAVYLKQMGHEPAIFAYYGLSGSRIYWNEIPVYPNNTDDYGAANAQAVYDHFKADCMITLVDAWVLDKMPDKIKWFPWVPIDHEPIPGRVRNVLAQHPGIYKPIAMSKFGRSELERCGIDCFYVPHMINCQLYSPDEDLRKATRKLHGWEDKFVIGKVGTNVRERKDWTSSFLGLQKFYRKHQDVVMYCHTDAFETRGRNLQTLREMLMIQDITRFPSLTELRAVGIPDTVMVSMYNSLDVYLSNSKGEGFGIPTIEAQACGVPAIVSNNTAQPELCGGGWLLKKMIPEFDEQSSWEGRADPDEIADCLEEAYEEKKSGKLAERKIAAREKAIEYDCAAVMDKYWKPVLADIEKMIKTPVERNKEKRIKQAKKLEGQVK